MPKPGNYVKKNGKFVLYETTNNYKMEEQAMFNARQAEKLAAMAPLAKGFLPRGPSANNLKKAAENAAAAYAEGVAVKYRKSRKNRKANRKANRKSRKATRRNRK